MKAMTWRSPLLALATTTTVALIAIAIAVRPAGEGDSEASTLSSAQLRAAAEAKIFEEEELRQLATSEAGSNAPLLLVVVGMVYNVSSGREFYASGSGYEGFANGTDASRAFLTADFDKNATDDLEGLSVGECMGIDHWLGFYANHSKYTFVGRLHGRFYDGEGNPTDAHRRFRECVEQGDVARRKAGEAIAAATVCVRETPTGEPRFARGKWATFSCERPHVPRRVTLGGDRCVCLAPGSAIEGGWDPETLGMQDDTALPQAYRSCNPEAFSCTVRMG